ncbi:MAG: TatD family hydrolase, partial [Nocardioides sp.]
MTHGPIRSRAATEEKSGARRDRERPPAPDPLPHPVVDNHCHLDIADGDWLATEEAIEAARAVNVTRIVQIGCDLPGARWAVEAAEKHDGLVVGVALHPNEAPRLAAAGELEAAYDEIERLAQAHDEVRAIGETGLDHFRTGEDGRTAQEESFRRHIDLAKRLDKTLVIHDRDAHDDVLRILDS